MSRRSAGSRTSFTRIETSFKHFFVFYVYTKLIRNFCAFTKEQLQAQVFILFDSYYNGILVSKIFWGLWLLPFGYLVFKSDLIPKTLGILLIIGCLGYLIDVFGRTLFDGYSDTFVPEYITLPAAFGEIGTCLWLLLVGIRKTK